MSELVHGTSLRRQALASHLRTAVLSLCTFAVMVFAAFAWWDAHNRRLPDDLVDVAETMAGRPLDPASAAEAPAKEPAVDPQVPAAAKEPPIARPAAPPPAVEPELAARHLLIPVSGVAASALRDSFEEGRIGHQHQAIDILAPRHTPVVAVEDGTVAKLFRSRFGGVTVYQFDRDSRYCYYYAHLQGYAPGLHEGEAVSRGQVLGYVGTTGNAPADAPHLHFQIYELTPEKRWWEGKPINPFPYLAGP